ncbi:MAG TPA: hypothetical protein DIS66_05555 [Candidatus Omnitrophica bacterium]|nr:hypothetical protein [Candidatus Omnitrophota bacterium]
MILSHTRHEFGREERKACDRVLAGGFLTGGPLVAAFEKSFCDFTHAPFSAAVSNGTTALHLACLALGVKPGDEVVVPAVSFIATANAVLYAGGTPVFAEVDLRTGMVTADSLRKAMTKKTRGVIVVHYMGQPADLKPIFDLTRRLGVFLIEDACHALGAKYMDSMIGECRYSDLSTFSFHPAKNITTGEGGMITSQSQKLINSIKDLRNHGMVRDPKRWKLKKYAAHAYYEVQSLGFNYRLTDMQCAIGIEQMKKLPRFLKTRRSLLIAYQTGLQYLPEIQVLKQDAAISGAHIFVIRIRETLAGFSRAELAAELSRSGIMSNIHYLPMPLHPLYQKILPQKQQLLDQCERFYTGLLSLPLHTQLNLRDVERICSVIRAFCDKHRQRKSATGFSSEKVVLSAVVLADLNKQYLDWLNDPRVNRFMAKQKYDFDDLSDYFQSVKASKSNSFLAARTGSCHIGNVLIEKKGSTGILGVMIGDARRHGKGWGSQVVRAACRYGFSKLKLQRMELGTLAGNNSALRCFTRCGFRITAIQKKNGQAVVRMRLNRGELKS